MEIGDVILSDKKNCVLRHYERSRGNEVALSSLFLVNAGQVQICDSLMDGGPFLEDEAERLIFSSLLALSRANFLQS